MENTKTVAAKTLDDLKVQAVTEARKAVKAVWVDVKLPYSDYCNEVGRAYRLRLEELRKEYGL